MANTTNYSWETPDDTDLVKDGAAAIRTLGSAIDTTTKALNPSTTLGDIEYRSSTANTNTRLPIGTAGQVLKVNSGGTAPEWATDSSGMTNPMTTTGDTIYSSSGSTPARLGIGTTGQVLTVSGGLPAWATLSAAGKNYTLLNSGGTALTGAATVTVSGISGKDSLLICIDGASSTAAGCGIGVRFNSDSSANYAWWGNRLGIGSSYSTNLGTGVGGFNNTEITLGIMSGTATSILRGSVRVDGGNSSGVKTFTALGGGTASGNSDQYLYSTNGLWNNSATISSVTVYTDGGTLDAGTVYIYTSA